MLAKASRNAAVVFLGSSVFSARAATIFDFVIGFAIESILLSPCWGVRRKNGPFYMVAAARCQHDFAQHRRPAHAMRPRSSLRVVDILRVRKPIAPHSAARDSPP